MIGYGTLTIQDYEVLMTGAGSLTLSNLQTASVTMSGTGEMVATASSNYGYALFPSLAGFGGDITSYGAGGATFPAMQSYAEGGLYVPVLTNYGFATFPSFVSSGILGTVSYLDGDAEFPALLGKGGEEEYGEGEAEFPSLVSSGIYDATPFERKLYSFCYALDGLAGRPVSVIVLNASGLIVDTISGNHIYISQLLASMQAIDNFTVLGSFLASLNASASVTGAVVAAIGDAAALDATTRVWVVNMDTAQSSQYDDYGFNDLVEHEGVFYGLADDGIYRLDGDTDNGSEIESYIDFGKSDLGVHGVKKVPNVYIGTSDGSDTYLRVTTDSGTATYQLEQCYRGPTGWRAQVPQTDMQGWEWRWELIANNAFELLGVEFVPIKLNKRG